MNEDKLIALVRNYSVLYDFTHSKYMETSYKNMIWKDIAKEMGMDVSSCKAKWENIRDNYKKSLEEPTTKKIKHKYSKRLEFLKEYLTKKDTKENIISQEEKDKIERDNEVREYEDQNQKYREEEFIVTVESETSTQISPNRTKKRPKCFKKKTSNLMEYLITTNLDQPHPVDAFLGSIAATLKSLHPYYLNLAKSEIFAIVQKYDMKMIMGHSPDLTSHCDVTQFSQSNISSISAPIISPNSIGSQQKNASASVRGQFPDLTSHCDLTQTPGLFSHPSIRASSPLTSSEIKIESYYPSS